MKQKISAVALVVSVSIAIWVVLSRGDMGSWIIGGPTVLLAAWATWVMWRSYSLSFRWLRIFSLSRLFVVESLHGGMEVLKGILYRGRVIEPAFISYRSSLMRPESRSLFLICVNLLPGTLVVSVEGNEFNIHALNGDKDPSDDIAQLEKVVAELLDDQRLQEAC